MSIYSFNGDNTGRNLRVFPLLDVYITSLFTFTLDISLT